MINTLLLTLLTQVPMLDVPEGFTARVAATSSEFRGPGGLAVDIGGRIVFQDPYGNTAGIDRFFALTAEGQLTTLNIIAGGFCWSSQVALDPAGNAYAFDVTRNRLIRVTPSGASTESWIGLTGGTSCSDSGGMGLVWHPIDQRLYISSPSTRAIYRLEGNTAVHVASTASPIFQLAVMPNGDLIGSDYLNANLVRIDRTTREVSLFAARANNLGYTVAVAVSPTGEVYAVAGTANGRAIVRVVNGQAIPFACAIPQEFQIAFGPGSAGGTSLYYSYRGSTIFADDGDGIVEIAGNGFDTGEVPVGCVVCGDGAAQGTETCDDGNTNDLDGCSATCQLERYQQPWQENEHGRYSQGDGYDYALGYNFTPEVDGWVTELGARINGTKVVRLFDRDTATLLAQTTVTGDYDWQFSPIAPVRLDAGRRYTVAVYLAGTGGTYRSHVTLPLTYGSIRIDSGAFAATSANPEAFPSSWSYQALNGQADIRFLPAAP